jgi:low affinity Fe/Cu permease
MRSKRVEPERHQIAAGCPQHLLQRDERLASVRCRAGFSGDAVWYVLQQVAGVRPMAMRELARQLARRTAGVVGSPWGFAGACAATVAWLVSGAATGFSDRWLLVPSAVASVVTLLIAFGLQYSQNRDTRAIQLKLDEILRTSDTARSQLVKLERLEDDQLAEIEADIEQERED